MAGTAVKAGQLGTVVHIDLAVFTLESIDADAGVSVLGVGASGAVLAYVRVNRALVHIVLAVLSSVLGWAFARVSIDAVHALSAILTKIVAAIVYVDLAFVAGETVWTVTLEVVPVQLTTPAVVVTWIRVARI